jgi:hypothetical protein
VFRLFAPGDRGYGFEADVGGEEKEGRRDQVKGAVLCATVFLLAGVRACRTSTIAAIRHSAAAAVGLEPRAANRTYA